MTVRRQTTRLGALAAAGLLAATVLSALTGPAADAQVAARAKAKPATGTVTFACVLAPLSSEYDYTAKVSITGKRAKPKAAVAALTGTMSALPAISPVAITGPMNVKLNLKVGGRATTMKGTIQQDVAPSTPIPMPKLKGKAKVAKSAKKLPVVVTGMSFDLPSYGFSSTCTPDAPTKLSKLKLG
jgi:hypothetical protein